MKREALRLYMETAPADPFDDHGPRQARVVAFDPGTGQAVPLTKVYRDDDQGSARKHAMAALARNVEASFTRYEAEVMQADLREANLAAEACVAALRFNAGRNDRYPERGPGGVYVLTTPRDKGR